MKKIYKIPSWVENVIFFRFFSFEGNWVSTFLFLNFFSCFHNLFLNSAETLFSTTVNFCYAQYCPAQPLKRAVSNRDRGLAFSLPASAGAVREQTLSKTPTYRSSPCHVASSVHSSTFSPPPH